MAFRQQYKQGRLKPEATQAGPLCMDTYRFVSPMCILPHLSPDSWMFDCCRVPGPEGLDWSVSYAVPGDTGVADQHIVVFRNNRVWKVQLTQDDQILNVRSIQKSVW
jgi:carnitine O-acetyltransferase